MQQDEPRLVVSKMDSDTHPTPREERQLGFVPDLAYTAKEPRRGSGRLSDLEKAHPMELSPCLYVRGWGMEGVRAGDRMTGMVIRAKCNKYERSAHSRCSVRACFL